MGASERRSGSITMIMLRPIAPGDDSFLAGLYASTRAEELSVTTWSDEEKAVFCRRQFDAQSAHYVENYPGASLQVIEQAGEPIGRLYVARWKREIRIMDIALLPAQRGTGIGTQLLHELQEEARSAGKTLSIHVERFNPALRLYERLGFQRAEEQPVYLLMRWGGETTPPNCHPERSAAEKPALSEAEGKDL